MRRFKDRLTNPLKRWKLSYEDFRNRSRWADYEAAIEDMMEKTSHRWVLEVTAVAKGICHELPILAGMDLAKAAFHFL